MTPGGTRIFERLFLRPAPAVFAALFLFFLVAPNLAHARRQIDWDDRQSEQQAKGHESPPALTAAEFRSLTSIIHPEADQNPTFDELFQSYEAKLSVNRRKFGHWYRQTFMPNGVWNNDSEIWTKAQPIIEKYRTHCQTLRKNLLEDAKLLLTAEQADLWPKVEARLKRRDAVSTGAMQIGIARLDVEDLLRTVMGGPLPEATSDTLTGYQDAVDRAAATAGAWTEENSKYPRPENPGPDADNADFGRRWQASYYARAVEQWKPLRDVNLAAFRRALPTLPDDKKDRARLLFFRAGTKESGWSWFGDQGLNFDNITSIKSLTPEQREQIAIVRADFEKQAADRAEKIATEIIQAQDDDPLALGDRQDAPGDWTRVAQELVDSEKKPRARLKDILTDEQHEQAGLGKKGAALEVPKFDQ